MRIFKHEGNGHYIGSCIVVAARDKVQARSMIRKELDSGGLKDEDLNIQEIKIKKAIVIYSNNGDY